VVLEETMVLLVHKATKVLQGVLVMLDLKDLQAQMEQEVKKVKVDKLAHEVHIY